MSKDRGLACLLDFGHFVGMACRSGLGSKQIPTLVAVTWRLPQRRFLEVPPVAQARLLAADLRGYLVAPDGAPRPVTRLLEELGWRVTTQELDLAKGGLKAAMAPTCDGFVFVVDERPPAGVSTGREWLDETCMRTAVRDFRLAHELGHIFFYDRGTPARRLSKPSDAEEVFCDAFAAALLLPKRAGQETVPVDADDWIAVLATERQHRLQLSV